MKLDVFINIILFATLSSLLNGIGYGVNTGEYWVVLGIVLCIVINVIIGLRKDLR